MKKISLKELKKIAGGLDRAHCNELTRRLRASADKIWAETDNGRPIPQAELENFKKMTEQYKADCR